MARAPLDRRVFCVGVARELPVVPEATTSRALIDNDAVRVVQLIRGRLRFELQGEGHELEAGDVVYLAPGAAHGLHALEPSMASLVLVHER